MTKAAYIRHLVTLGLAQEKGKIKDSNTYQTSKKYDKVLLTAMLETAYNCSAFLGSPAMDNAKKQALLEASREKADDTVTRLFDELDETTNKT